MLEGMIPYLCRATKQTLLLVILLVAVFSHVSLALAQAFPPGSSADPFTQPFVNTGNNPGNTNAPGYFTNISGSPTGPNPNSVTGNPTNGGDGSIDGGLYAGAANAETQQNQAGNVPTVQVNYACYDGIGIFLHCITVSVFGGLAAVAGYALDRTIEWFIVDFGEMYNQNGLGAVADSVWETVRDIFNLTFIFGLVYIGFQIILGTNDSAAKRTIPLLIIAALLVNFSLFIVKFIVDFANLAAVQIYNLFQASNDSSNPASSVVGFLTDGDVSIALAFLNIMGVTSLLGYQPNGDSPLIFFFGTIIVFLVLTYVFLAGAVMISVRFVALIFYIIFSPIMFLGWVFPGLDSYTKQFWKGLINQAFFAPAFLFMLYISFRLIQGYNFAGRTGTEVHTLGETVAGQSVTASLAAIVPFFILTVIFLLASVIVARKMASSGSEMVMKANNFALGKTMSYVGRNTIGRTSAGFGKLNEKMEGTRTGRWLKTGITVASLGTFDERTRQAVFDAGKKAKFGGSYSRADDKSFAQQLSNTRSDQEERVRNKKILSEGLAASAIMASSRTPEQHAAIQKMAGVVSKMGVGDVEKMDAKTRVNIAEFFTNPLMEKISDSKELTDAAKYEIKSARKEALKKLIGQVGDEAATITAEVAKLTIEQIEELGDEWVTKHADILTTTQMDKIKDSKKFNPYQKNQFSSTRSKLLSTSNRTKDYFYQIKANNEASRRKASEVAGLGRDVFMREDGAALSHLNVDILEAIADKKTLGADDRRKLAEKINGLDSSINKEADNMRDWLKSPQGLRTWGGKG